MVKTTKSIATVLAVGLFLGLIASAQAAIVTQPAGLNPGDEYRLAFLTNDTIWGREANGGPSTIDGYNTFVTNAATGVTELNDLATTWKAVVGFRTSAGVYTTARDNTGTTGGGVPIYNLGGLKVADDNADLWDGSIQNPINVTELDGGPPADNLVNTGTLSNGATWHDGVLGNPSGGWIGRGLANATDAAWIQTNRNPDVQRPIYAMSEVLTVPGTPPPPSGETLVYESMSHTTGTGQLDGKTADTGLGAWDVNPSGAGQIVSPGMSYTDGNGNVLPTTGNRFQTAGSNDDGRASIDISTGGWSAANKEGGKLNAKGAEIWFSALMSCNTSTHNHFHLDFTDSANGNATWANGPGYFAVGKDTGNSNWEIRGDNDDGDSDQVHTSTVSVANDTFIIGRFSTDDTTGDTTFDVWFNPLIDDESNLGAADGSITVLANDDGSVTQFDTLGYWHQKWEGPNLLDEIRMGQTFNSVVGQSDAGPIPEPATMAALGLAVTGLGGYVRKRRKA